MHSLISFFLLQSYVFGVGECNTSCFGIFVKQQAVNCFWKIWVALRRKYNFNSSGGFTAADAWGQLTAGEAEAGLVAADVLAAWC